MELPKEVMGQLEEGMVVTRHSLQVEEIQPGVQNLRNGFEKAKEDDTAAT